MEMAFSHDVPGTLGMDVTFLHNFPGTLATMRGALRQLLRRTDPSSTKISLFDHVTTTQHPHSHLQ